MEFYVLREGSEGKTFLEPGKEISIGRDPACGIHVSDETVSRKHATITLNHKNEIKICDLSSFGTKVNDVKLKKNVPEKIASGARILIGRNIGLTLSRNESNFGATKRKNSGETVSPKKPRLSDIDLFVDGDSENSFDSVVEAMESSPILNFGPQSIQMDAVVETNDHSVVESSLMSNLFLEDHPVETVHEEAVVQNPFIHRSNSPEVTDPQNPREAQTSVSRAEASEPVSCLPKNIPTESAFTGTDRMESTRQSTNRDRNTDLQFVKPAVCDIVPGLFRVSPPQPNKNPLDQYDGVPNFKKFKKAKQGYRACGKFPIIIDPEETISHQKVRYAGYSEQSEIMKSQPLY